MVGVALSYSCFCHYHAYLIVHMHLLRNAAHTGSYFYSSHDREQWFRLRLDKLKAEVILLLLLLTFSWFLILKSSLCPNHMKCARRSPQGLTFETGWLTAHHLRENEELAASCKLGQGWYFSTCLFVCLFAKITQQVISSTELGGGTGQ